MATAEKRQNQFKETKDLTYRIHGSRCNNKYPRGRDGRCMVLSNGSKGHLPPYLGLKLYSWGSSTLVQDSGNPPRSWEYCFKMCPSKRHFQSWIKAILKTVLTDQEVISFFATHKKDFSEFFRAEMVWVGRRMSLHPHPVLLGCGCESRLRHRTCGFHWVHCNH